MVVTEKMLDGFINAMTSGEVWGRQYSAIYCPILYAGHDQIEHYKQHYEYTEHEGKTYIRFDKPKNL